MSAKKRLDLAVFEAGLTESRERAKTAVMAGLVYVNGNKEDKPGTQVSETDKIELRGSTLKYVSRGGLKLEKAMSSFGVMLEGKVCGDIGASTGGFTDCMLQNGATKVYAVDVGYGQLAWKLRTDERVVNMERTNIRYVTPEQLSERPDFCSVDVSFISLTLVLPVLKTLLSDDGEVVCLIKPQFEAGREKVGKKGVVRDPDVHREVIVKILNFLNDTGYRIYGLDYSPIKGPEGNIEYLVYAGLCEKESALTDIESAAKNIVELSHSDLG